LYVSGLRAAISQTPAASTTAAVGGQFQVFHIYTSILILVAGTSSSEPGTERLWKCWRAVLTESINTIGPWQLFAFDQFFHSLDLSTQF